MVPGKKYILSSGRHLIYLGPPLNYLAVATYYLEADHLERIDKIIFFLLYFDFFEFSYSISYARLTGNWTQSLYSSYMTGFTGWKSYKALSLKKASGENPKQCLRVLVLPSPNLQLIKVHKSSAVIFHKWNKNCFIVIFTINMIQMENDSGIVFTKKFLC